MNSLKIYALKHLALVIISGDDRETFLQGQLTNDVRDLTQGASQLSGICTPKGRMLANMRLLPGDNSYLMLLAAELTESIRKRLSMYVLRSQVTIESGDGYGIIGISGDVTQLLPEAKTLTQIDQAIITDDGCTITLIAGDQPRYIITGPAAAIERKRQLLADTAEIDDDSAWQLADIRAGLPLVQQETVEAFVPQMTNMGLINGISFTKGCYTGQEVVARMQYLGKLKRRMYRVEIDADCPAAGTALFSPGSQSGQGAGRVVMSAPCGNNRCEALIVTEVSSAESGEVRLIDEHGPRLKFLQLPYQFETTA